MDGHVIFSTVVHGRDISIGSGFQAKQFDQESFAGLMDPILMINHFVETETTFSSHPHAGLSVVTFMFEDSVGHLISRDSMGNVVPIYPGDAHWFVSGHGAMHREDLSPDAKRVHALQVFVNLPNSLKKAKPYFVHLDAALMSRVKRPSIRSRSTSPADNSVKLSLPQRFTIADIFLNPRTRQQFATTSGLSTVLLVIDGTVQVYGAGRIDQAVIVKSGEAVAFREATGAPFRWRVRTPDAAHIVALSGEPVGEPVYRHGPFSLSSPDDLPEILDAYNRGDFEQID